MLITAVACYEFSNLAKQVTGLLEAAESLAAIYSDGWRTSRTDW